MSNPRESRKQFKNSANEKECREIQKKKKKLKEEEQQKMRNKMASRYINNRNKNKWTNLANWKT